MEDLNDWIEPLGGHPQAYTPNISRLAAQSTLFSQAYAAAPACSPSRTSTLFGQSPWRTGIYHNRQSWAMRYPVGDKLSVVGQARKAGWETIGAGKVFHTGSSGLDMADWSNYFHTPTDAFLPFSKAVSTEKLGMLSDFGPLNSTAPPLYDERNLANFKEVLTKGSVKKFWAFGVYRPHLPFIVPRRFFDLIKVPVQMPPSFHGVPFDPSNESELLNLPEAAKKMINRGTGRALAKTKEYDQFLHSYLASIAFADYIVGEVLDQLEKSRLMNNTLIVFWSDHGWQLGEKLAFRKFTLWERALRVPLLVRYPDGISGVNRSPVSLLDIYPTLLDAMDLTPPYEVDGQNLMPLIDGSTGRGYAQSMWERFDKKPEAASYLASTVRTNEFRLIRYHDGSFELYNHNIDPFEKINLIDWKTGKIAQGYENKFKSLLKLLPIQPATALNSSDLPSKLATRKTNENGRIFIS